MPLDALKLKLHGTIEHRWNVLEFNTPFYNGV